MNELEEILAGMQTLIAWMETFRAGLEGVGFSREAAESMTARYFWLVSSAMDRANALRHIAALAQAQS